MIPNTNIIPSCFWIDKNGDHPYTALSLNWVDMQSNEEDVRLGRNVTEESLGYDLCDSPTFSLCKLAPRWTLAPNVLPLPD